MPGVAARLKLSSQLPEAAGPKTAAIVLFRPGTPSGVLVDTVGPKPILPGDVNGDEVVDVNDLIELIQAWGPCPPEPDTLCPADIGGNGVVDVNDLVVLIESWTN